MDAVDVTKGYVIIGTIIHVASSRQGIEASGMASVLGLLGTAVMIHNGCSRCNQRIGYHRHYRIRCLLPPRNRGVGHGGSTGAVGYHSRCNQRIGYHRHYRTGCLLPPRNRGVGHGVFTGDVGRNINPTSTGPQPRVAHLRLRRRHLVIRSDETLDNYNGLYTACVPLRLAEMIKSTRPFQLIVCEFKKTSDVITFADLIYGGATIILGNVI